MSSTNLTQEQQQEFTRTAALIPPSTTETTSKQLLPTSIYEESPWETRIKKIEKRQDITDAAASTAATIFSAFKSRVNTAFSAIFDIPEKLKNKTVDATDSLAGKLGEYRKAMKGEGESSSADMFLIGAKHAEILKDMAANNAPLYCLIVKIADCWTSGSLASQYLRNAGSGDVAALDKCIVTNKSAGAIYMANLLLIYKQRKDFNPSSLAILELAKQQTVFPDDAAVQSFLSRV